MKECSKSIVRRLSDPNFLSKYFVGMGLDIGGAPDPLNVYTELFPLMQGAQVWDMEHGDAQFMQGVADDSIDFVHSSHCLEHLNDPVQGLQNWVRIVKPGGHVIVTVPDEDLYEQGEFPSTFNAGHTCSFTIRKKKSWNEKSRNLLDVVNQLGDDAEIVKIELLTASFRYQVPRFDQTLTPIAECAIELVIRKRLPEEIANGGRVVPEGMVSREGFRLLTGINLDLFDQQQKPD